MKKKYFYNLFLLFFLSTNLFAQSDGPASLLDWLTSPRWEFYSDNTLSTIASGKGNTGVASKGDISLMNLNPASIDVDSKIQVFASYTYKSKFKLYSYSKDDDMQNIFPSVFTGAIYKINNNFQTGFAYRNDYGFKYKYPISGNKEISYSLITHTFTIPVTYNYKWLRAGANLNLTYFRGDAKGMSNEVYPEGHGDARSELWRFIPQIGIIVSPMDYLSFGLTYTTGFNDSTKWYIGDTNAKFLDSPVKYPYRLGIGAELKLYKNKLRISFDYHFEKTSFGYKLKDKNMFNFGVEYSPVKEYAIRTGFYTINDFRDLQEETVVESTKYDLVFFTLGGTYKYKGFSFNLALMDSHLLFKSDIAHTKINAGFGFEL